MIQFTTGNMFESGADCLVNTVNCEGYMGKGIAYQFKLRFPENNKAYVKECRSGRLRPGVIHYFVEDSITIVNFPTKDKWRLASKMEYIEDGMKALVDILPQMNVKKIAIPPLGCGNGGLDWGQVKGQIVKYLEPIQQQYDFLIYEPGRSYNAKPKLPPKMNVSSLILLKMRLNLQKFNNIRLQKTGYFTNIFLGEEYFKFDKWKYGPYSHAITIVAKSIREYQTYYDLDNSKDTYDMVYKTICSEKVNSKLQELETAVIKAAGFVNEIETDKMLEGISTIVYLLQNGGNMSVEEIVYRFQNWSVDKSERFDDGYIVECVQHLEKMGMIAKDDCGRYGIIPFKRHTL